MNGVIDTMNCRPLEVDEACLTVISYLNTNLTLGTQSEECENCPIVAKCQIETYRNYSIVLDTVYGSELEILISSTQTSACFIQKQFVEHGKYFLNVTQTDRTCDPENASCVECSFIAADVPSPLYTYLPIILASVAFLGIIFAWMLISTLYRRQVFHRIVSKFSQNVNDQLGPSASSVHELSSSTQVVAPVKKERLRSLDTFRGIAIVIMIFVNYGGGGYKFFEHPPWNGLTVADLVFPWFMWIMGVSMAMSLRSVLRKALPKSLVVYKITKRAVILFSLGIILNTSHNANNLELLRIPGVLQRFAIAYFAVATLHLCFARLSDTHADRIWAPIRDVLLYWPEWIFMLCLMLIYFLLTFVLPVPGCPAGYLGPGGIHDGGKYENCTGGAAGYIDRIILGSNHIYSHPSCKKIYKTNMPYDPEGILGCLPSIFLVYLGLQCGKILLTYKDWRARIKRFLVWCLIMGVIATALCKGTKNDGIIPVNKNLWSFSYIMTTGSMAFFLISVCYYLQDVLKIWSGAPFYHAGMNSILLYVGHSLTGRLFPWYWDTVPTHGSLLAVSLWGTSLWVLISVWLYRIDFFLSI